MNWINLLDGPSAGIVLGGTVLATLLRCGWRDCGIALTQLSQLGQPGFDAERHADRTGAASAGYPARWLCCARPSITMTTANLKRRPRRCLSSAR